MSSNGLKAKAKAAEEAVKDLEKDLRKSAFEIILKSLLERSVSESTLHPSKNTGASEPRAKAKTLSPVSMSPIALDLKGGKSGPSLRDFYRKKAPKSNQEKVTTFVYYIGKHLGIPDVLPGHIVSCYNEVNEKKPLNIVQLFKDIKHHKGWIETGTSAHSVKISIAGENLVEHDLPRSLE